MEQQTFTLILSVMSICVTMGSLLTMVWKAFTFLNKVESKSDRSDLEKTNKHISDIQYKLTTIEREVQHKVNVTDLQLLLKDIEILKKDMVTKKDFESFKREMISLIKHINEKDEE